MTKTERAALTLLGVLAAGTILVPLLSSHDPLVIDDVLKARLVGPCRSTRPDGSTGWGRIDSAATSSCA